MAGQTLREGYAMSNPKAPPAEWMLEAAKELGRQRRHITGYQPVEEVARVIARFAPAPEEREPDSSSVMQDDMAELLRVLGLGDHARPCSPHEVMVNEIIPAVRQLVRLPKAPAPASPTVADHAFQECWGEPHRSEWGPIDGCHSQAAFPCGKPRSAHPAAAPEPDYSWFRGKVDERLVKEFVKSEPPAPSPAPEPIAEPICLDCRHPVSAHGAKGCEMDYCICRSRNTSAPSVQPAAVKVERSKEWWMEKARAEGDATIGAGAPEPITIDRIRRMRKLAGVPLKVAKKMLEEYEARKAAPAPSVQPATCDCWHCYNGHPENCAGPEPAAQDRLGEIADRIVNNKCCRDDHDWFGQGCHICAHAELERVVRECGQVVRLHSNADEDGRNLWADVKIRQHWGLK